MIRNALPKSLLDNPRMGAWLSFERPGRVIVRTGKVELGQGIETALAQIAAEELDVAITRIDMLPAGTSQSPNEGITAGSQSVEVSGASIRLAAAQVRSVMLQAAASRLAVSDRALTCRDGGVFHDGVGTALDYWTLAADLDWDQPVTGQVPVKDVRNYAIVGASAPRADFLTRLTRGGFIHDLCLDGMLHARVIRQPFRLARLALVDEAWLQRRYPRLVAFRRNDFLALVGDDEYAAHSAQAEAASFVVWAAPGTAPTIETAGRMTVFERDGLERAPRHAQTFSARYSRANIAHASIGPSCGVAWWRDGRLTVSSHSQGIFNLRDQIAKCLSLDPESVELIHAQGAGCYGHNGADDAALDAAIVAMAFPDRPVRVQWSREDELSRGPLGAAMTTTVEAALDDDGAVTDWTLSVVSQPHAQRPGFGGFVNLSSAEALDAGRLPKKVEELPEAGGGGASRNGVALYDFPGHRVSVELEASSAIRTSSLRSLGSHLNVFAIESAMDELADIAGVDPLEFRLRHLSDARCRGVLDGVAQMSGWSGRRGMAGEGRALGIAAARYKNKGAWLAAVAEVGVDEEVRVERLWLCVDAGLIVNPDGARNQIEGGAIQAASWTLKEQIPVQDGRIPALDWLGYPILRFSEIPEIETRFIVDPAMPPLGAGEASQGPVAAAIGNAASRALGLRMRDLPLTRERIVGLLMEA